MLAEPFPERFLVKPFTILTPEEAAPLTTIIAGKAADGIVIEGENKWLSLLRNAIRSEARTN